MSRLINILLPISIFSIVACTTERTAEPITFGQDQCAYCRMTISNPKFGSELITDKGRILKYDATECMVNQLNSDEAPKYQKLYAVPHDMPKTLKPVHELHFLISPDFRSPMGANLAAFSDKKYINNKYHSQLMDWPTLLHKLQ